MFALWIGCGQQSRKLMGKQEAELPGVGGTWPFSCRQSLYSHQEVKVSSYTQECEQSFVDFAL